MAKTINVAMIGQGFMGRSHSNAWGQVKRFFRPEIIPVLHTVTGLEFEHPEKFAAIWDWKNASTNWEETIKDPAIGLVDIVTPNFMHAPPAKAAIAAGKPVACEKPISATLDEARDMATAAEEAGVESFVWFCYRRAPAVALAYKMVREGKIGEIRHIRATYLQQWADDSVPFAWRFKKAYAGSGAHGDLNAHIVDMTRFISGLNVTEICGAITETFVKERVVPSGNMTDEELRYSKDAKTGTLKAEVEVDDTTLFLCRFNNGAIGSYEAARQATGNFNRNSFEINGTKGSLKFNFEDMNYLQFFDATLPAEYQGWTKILCTDPHHPYVANYWPAGHLIGYEHGFTSMAYDILRKLNGEEPVIPLPSFTDAYNTQRVLEAALRSAEKKEWVLMDDVK